MVPTSVMQAWAALTEPQRVAVSRLCAKKQPAIFMRWVEAAKLKNFRQDSLVNRKGGAAPRLDAVLFKAEEGQLAADLLVAYFTELAPTINDDCLALLEKAGSDEEETKLKVYAQIAHNHQGSPLLQLYLVTLLWVEGFAEDQLAVVEAMAAELGAAANA
jgi:hypothetical protein